MKTEGKDGDKSWKWWGGGRYALNNGESDVGDETSFLIVCA